MREKVGRLAAGLQGVAGVACLAVGAYLIAGVGVGLVVAGLFLVAAAWMDQR